MKKIFFLLLTFVIVRAADAQVTVIFKNGVCEYTRIVRHDFSPDSSYEVKTYEVQRIPESDTAQLDALKLTLKNEVSTRKSERDKQAEKDAKKDTSINAAIDEIDKKRKGKKGAAPGGGKKEAETPNTGGRVKSSNPNITTLGMIPYDGAPIPADAIHVNLSGRDDWPKVGDKVTSDGKEFVWDGKQWVGDNLPSKQSAKKPRKKKQ